MILKALSPLVLKISNNFILSKLHSSWVTLKAFFQVFTDTKIKMYRYNLIIECSFIPKYRTI